MIPFDLKKFLTENKTMLAERESAATDSPEYRVFLKVKDELHQAYKDILNSPDSGALSIFSKLVKSYRTAHGHVYGKSI